MHTRYAIPRRPRWSRGGAAALALAVAIGACTRDRAAESDEPTPAERADFSAPADSSLTPEQVDRYLRTSLRQFEVLKAEAPAVRERLAAVPERARPDSTRPGGARPKSRQALWGDFVDGAFVRSARQLGYNPAELWYVRTRMAIVSGHLLGAEAHASSDASAALFRQQAEAMRGAPGVSPAQIQAMLQAAARAEQQQAPPPPAPKVAQNLEALRRARGSLSDSAWRRVAAVAAGIGMSDLGSIPAGEAEQRLGGFRDLYQEALENREPPG
jgi:hypothetical protein